MTVFRKLRLRSLLKSLLFIMLPLLFAGLITPLAISEFKEMNREPVELYSVPARELEGAYVTVEIPLIYEVYAYEGETVNDVPNGKITSKEYIIDANEADFCGLSLADELIEKGDQLYSDTIKYLTGELSEISSTFRVTGVMRAMSGDRLDFYRNSDIHNLLGNNSDSLLPFYLDAETKKECGSFFIVLGLGLFSLVFSVFFAARALSGVYQKQLTDKASELTHGAPEYLSQRIAQMDASARKQNGICVDNELVFLDSGLFQYLYKTDDIVWAYQKTVKKGFNRSYFLVIGGNDGQLIELEMTQEKVRVCLEDIFATMPWCAIGYSALCNGMFRRNRDALRTIAQAQRRDHSSETKA